MELTQTDTIRIRGVRVHNLQNVNVDIPRDALVVLTGVSGSGKSSLAFDTLFAEGQRRYLESLSAYTRQYLDQLERPDADSIDGLPPTISIDQRTGSTQPRSTVAVATEIYDYMRLLYARAGQAHCPACKTPVSRQTPQAIVDQVLALEHGRKVMILAPLVRGRKGTHVPLFEKIAKEGYVRARVDGQVVDANEPPALAKTRPHNIEAVIDRIVVKEGIRPRLQESVEAALKLGEGTCIISHEADGQWIDRLLSEKFSCPQCGTSFPELEPRTFSFNSPYGACPVCEGLGITIPRERSREPEELEIDFAAEPCPACGGSRLNPFARSVTFAGTPLSALVAQTVAGALQTVQAWEKGLRGRPPEITLSPENRLVAERTLPEILSRLEFLFQVGLDYLALDRPTRTLSGGEFQRTRLAACLGSGLTGVCYLLDEPTIGLHPRDTGKLVGLLEKLRDQGNSVLVVEHDLETMRRADWIVDLGPGAGRDGGRIVAAGPPGEIEANSASVTGRYLAMHRPPQSRTRRKSREALVLKGARLHNLKHLDVAIPLGVLVCVTGVSGSGKTSLVAQTLVPAVAAALAARKGTPRGNNARHHYDALEGVEHIQRLVEVDQSPLGRSGRSNPATYSGIWDEVRRVFAQTREARIRGYTARRFSFNSPGGRCEVCKGHGTRRIEMHFMPDMHVTCPACRGTRFNRQTRRVKYAGKSVADALEMRIDEAAEFFSGFPKLAGLLSTFRDVGLGYLALGQSSLTLSGGEAQRVRLATELGRSGGGKTLFVLDEPTTGLHPADVERLLGVLDRLVDQGHSVLVIEHHLDLVAAADWVIDLGPEGGAAGGRIVAEGTPEMVTGAAESHTGRALKAYFANSSA